MFEDYTWDHGFNDDVEEYGSSCLYDDFDSSCLDGSDSELFEADYCIYTDPIDMDECLPYQLDVFDINSINGSPMINMGGY